MTSQFKPMLASPAELDILTYPLYASPKLDGIRAVVYGGRLVSRKLLDIPNRNIVPALLKDTVQKVGAKLGVNGPLHALEGLDGELIDGDPTADDCYRRTNSLVMAHDKPITETLNFHLFDVHGMGDGFGYARRLEHLQGRLGDLCPHFCVLTQTLIKNRDELDEFEANAVAKGYEGVMLRAIDGRYKYGRSTAKEGILLKLKRFEDSEAEILGVEEEMANNNVAEKDNLGRTKRSSAKDGKVGKGTMGALVVRDLKTGVEFNIGTGFTAADRRDAWKPGEIVRYRFFPIGVKDRPRHPVFAGRRSKIDL